MLILTQPGYENFTGTLGNIRFVEGKSIYDVSPQQASGILNTIQGYITLFIPNGVEVPADLTPVGNPKIVSSALGMDSDHLADPSTIPSGGPLK